MTAHANAPNLSPQDARQLLLKILQNSRDESPSNLSSGQHRLWLLRQFDPALPAHVFNAVELRGPLHVDVLEQSASEVIGRHEILRSMFVDLGKGPARIVAAAASVNLHIVNAEGLSEQQYQEELKKLAERDSQEPFDLRSAPLVRLTLVSHSQNRHTLMITMHELVGDSLSTTIFIEELLSFYEARLAAKPSSLPEPTERFGVLAREEKEWLKTTECEDQFRYWQETLAEVPVLHLPTDFARPAIKTHRGSAERCNISNEMLAALDQIAGREGATLQTLFLAAFNTLLAWYSGQDDLAIGIPADRSSERGIGPLTNTLVIRTDATGNPTFSEMLGRIHREVNAAQRQQRIPFAKLVIGLQPERDLSRTPLFQAKFVAEDEPFRDLSLQTLQLTPLDLNRGDGMFDITLSVALGDEARLALEYNTDLFQPETIRRMLAHLRLILDRVAADARQPISRLMILPETERRLLALEWNQTERPFEHNKCIHQLIEEQAGRSPDAEAIVCGEQRLSYRELNEQSNRLAKRLRRHGIRPESRVAVCLGRSPETIIALLAVLKAGGAYIPLDPEFPAERLAFILRDGDAQVVLARRDTCSNLPDSFAKVLLLDDDFDDEAAEARHEVTPANLAYIIYTSGSTGQPKGVAVTHESVVNNLAWRQSMWPLSAADRVLQNYSFTFDPSVWATFWPLLAGSCVVLPRSARYFDSMGLARLLVDERITVYGAAPSLHSVLVEESEMLSRTALRYVFSGGESLEPELQVRFQETLSANVYNVYGPTEATIDCTYRLCPREKEPRRAPIGTPIANTQIYILNKNLELSPVGVAGEIFIGGTGLARGYVGHPGLTSEKFLPNPFSRVPGARMYRTGDVGRQEPDGAIQFVGRTDEQVKIRGFRIELSEIERALMLHEGVSEAAVAVTQTSTGEPRITAYVSFNQGQDSASSDELTALLKERLPVYMIPDLFITLSALPRTSTGKVNRRALPLPDEMQTAPSLSYVPPRTPLEAEISIIVGTVLGLERISIEADLFGLGCNSLLMARIASRLSSTYEMGMPVTQIFKAPTVVGLAGFIDKYQQTGQRAAAPAWTLEQLEAEAVVDPSITVDGLPVADYCSPSNIFLTGVTGYLGAFLLERFLLESTADVYCLVRASSITDGHQRIQKIMEQYQIWNDVYRDRIHAVVGDLSKPLLGLSESEFTELAETADVIYHCGALVNFVYPYSALKPANVQGTHEVIRLACSEKLKAIHYTSTVDVLLATHIKRPFLENEEPILNPTEIPDGYARSKWVGEKMVAIARSRGVPVSVYRPGLVMGHTQTGATQTNDYLLVGLKGYIDLGVLPEPSIMIDFVTVDYVAKVMAHLSRQPDSIGKYFHIWNPQPVHIGKSYEWIQSFGYNLEVVPRNVLRQRASKVDASNAMYPFLAGFKANDEDSGPGPSPSHDPSVVETIDIYSECKNTFQGLERSSIECPPLNEQMAHLCFSYLTTIGFLPHPAS